MKRVHFFLPDPIAIKMQLLSKELDVSFSELVRRAVEAYLASKVAIK